MRRIYLTVLLSLSLMGCDDLPDMPVVSKWMLDFENKKCAEFRLVDPVKMLWQYIGSVEIEKCDSFFAMSPDDEAAIKEYQNKVKLKYKQLQNDLANCQSKNGG